MRVWGKQLAPLDPAGAIGRNGDKVPQTSPYSHSGARVLLVAENVQ